MISLINKKWAMLLDAVQVGYELLLDRNKLTVEEIAIGMHGGQYKKYLENGEIKSPNARYLQNASLIKGSNNAYQYDNVGIIPMFGVIYPREMSTPSYGSSISLDEVSKDLLMIESKQDITKILMVYDSPGGEVTGVSDASNLIKSLKKPVYSYVSGMAASAAYWLASSGKKLMGENTSEFGSIGVVVSYIDKKGVDEKNGIKRHTLVSSLSPNKNLDITTDEGKSEMMKILDGIAEIFIDSVAKNRKTTFENVVENFGKGGMFLAGQAKELGMIDEISTFQDVLKKLTEKEMIINKFSQIKGENMTLEELKNQEPEAYKSMMELAQQSVKLEASQKDIEEKAKGICLGDLKVTQNNENEQFVKIASEAMNKNRRY
jgi:signal peptide peptidase SppA